MAFLMLVTVIAQHYRSPQCVELILLTKVSIASHYLNTATIAVRFFISDDDSLPAELMQGGIVEGVNKRAQKSLAEWSFQYTPRSITAEPGLQGSG